MSRTASTASSATGSAVAPARDLDVGRVLAAVRRATCRPQGPIPLHAPDFTAAEVDDVVRAVETTLVSTAVPEVGRLEAALVEATGAAHAVATINGTAALHVALLLAGVEPGDEVLVPALTFVATANAVTYLSAVPHLVDCSADGLGIDPEALTAHLEEVAELGSEGCRNRRSGRTIRALVPMHTFGMPADLDALAEIAGRWRLALVEDAANALGSRYKGRHVGTRGVAGVISFNANKIVTTGGGGALLTDRADVAERARHLTSTAKLDHPWAYVHDAVGYNYRMPGLNAALGCGQIRRLEELVERKRRLARRYAEALAGIEGLAVVPDPPWGRSNRWLVTAELAPGLGHWRDPLLERAHAAGIQLRPPWTPLHRLPMYRDNPRASLARTDDLADRLVCLPSGPRLGGEEAA